MLFQTVFNSLLTAITSRSRVKAERKSFRVWWAGQFSHRSCRSPYWPYQGKSPGPRWSWPRKIGDEAVRLIRKFTWLFGTGSIQQPYNAKFPPFDQYHGTGYKLVTLDKISKKNLRRGRTSENLRGKKTVRPPIQIRYLRAIGLYPDCFPPASPLVAASI